jgi:signal transduction histidine kinase
MQIETSQVGRLSKALYVVIALVILFILAEAIIFQARAPSPEFTLNSTDPSIVDRVLPNSEAASAGLQSGDVIQKIDNVPFDWSSLANFSSRYSANQVIQLAVSRNGAPMIISIPLVEAGSLNLDRISFISLFVIIGGTTSIVLLMRFIRKREAQVLYLLTQAAGVALLLPATQFSSWTALTDWQMAAGSLAASLSILLSFHFVMTFPVKIGQPGLRRIIFGALYALGLVIAVIWALAAYGKGSIMAELVAAGLLLLIFLATGLILLYVYLRVATIFQRRQLRLVALGFLISVGPTVFLYSLPKVFLGSPIMPDWLAGVCLLASLMVYVYSILRQNLTQADQFLNRTVVYFVLFALTLTVLVIPVLLLDQILPNDWILQAFILAGLTLLVAFSFVQVRQWVQKKVDGWFYGGWYDYPKVVELVGEALAHALKWDQLEEILTRQVPNLMSLTGAWLTTGEEPHDPATPGSQMPIRIVLNFEDKPYAVWSIGPRRDGDFFSSSDRNIFTTLTPQIDVALSNILHVEKLREQLDQIRASQSNLTQMGHQLIRSRDEEQERLSRELHDGPLQELVGINLQLGLLLSKTGPDGTDTANRETLTSLRSDVRSLMNELRAVCTGLRPPMLDTLGLSSALQVLVNGWSSEEGIPVRLELTPDASLSFLTGEVGLNLYRVVQEALSNIAHHAAASHVGVTLTSDLQQESMTLTVQDDGKGFDPLDVNRHAALHHFGLASMQERVKLIGGHWNIVSSVGNGTTIQVTWQNKDWLASDTHLSSAAVSKPG